jgi:acetate kinase
MNKNQLLVINAGSSSIKFASFDFDSELKKTVYGAVDNVKVAPRLKIFDADHNLVRENTFPADFRYHQFYELLIAAFETNQFNYKVEAVGHRVVHGGANYQTPVLVTPEILQYLEGLNPFAPLHQPYNLEAIKCIYKTYPELPQVACFDTAFHRTHPWVADWFGLPRSMTEAGIKRYGFHGLSYEYIMHQFKALKPKLASQRIIVAHLGNGASLCAIKEGKSIDSTMGFTALDGLIMGTRCGGLDPGVILYLLQNKNMTAKEIEETLYKKSGLLGISGISNNMKILLEQAAENSAAKEAIELFVYRIRHEIGALIAVLGGIDALIFTGGIGEHASQIREKICVELDWIGLAIEHELNNKNQAQINTNNSKVEVFVIPTNEEWMIAEHSYQLLKGGV